MSMFFLGIGIAFLIFIIYMVIHEYSAMQSRSKPASWTGYKPSVKPITPAQADFQVAHKGSGAYTTEAIYLNPVIYRLEYQFPQNAKVKVDLISADGSIHKTLVEKTGFGSNTFNAPIGKYYVLRVEPEQVDADWAIVLKPF